jgi:hypothetical protein
MRRLRAIERALVQPAQGAFGERELDGLPEPVRRMFLATIAPDTPLSASARITMHGRIKLKRWTTFSGREVIAPHRGFVWSVRAGVISGFDRYTSGESEMRWKLLGLIPVMHAAGPDVNRSAAGRVAGEAAWLPTTLLPRFGVQWDATDDKHLTARFRLDSYDLELNYLIDDEARIKSCWFDRWGDPDNTGTHALHPFAMEATAQREFSGLTIPSVGRAGWHYGTDCWDNGVFFEYEITGLDPYT